MRRDGLSLAHEWTSSLSEMLTEDAIQLPLRWTITTCRSGCRFQYGPPPLAQPSGGGSPADRKRGGSYRVREKMQSIHRACHACDGHDPYDGLPLRGELLLPSVQSDQFHRCPAVGHRQSSPVADFEILSRQTKQAKGQLSAEDYLAHCRAVVQQAERRQPS